MAELDSTYLAKAHESLAGAVAAYSGARYNNCANRCYYACFHAATYALEAAGVTSRSGTVSWSHEGLQAAFASELIARRKLYSSELRGILLRNQELRLTADYARHAVTGTQASRAVRRTQEFVSAVQQKASAG
jgi:uncharacterized protein (UPF0332 family)